MAGLVPAISIPAHCARLNEMPGTRPGMTLFFLRLSIAGYPVGGATSSRLFCLASGPICVTATAAMKSSTASDANTVVSPKPFCTHRIVGMMTAVAMRPTPADQPKP
jgi:hypothetical protein